MAERGEEIGHRAAEGAGGTGDEDALHATRTDRPAAM
jgi:hypothetical protein